MVRARAPYLSARGHMEQREKEKVEGGGTAFLTRIPTRLFFRVCEQNPRAYGAAREEGDGKRRVRV